MTLGEYINRLLDLQDSYGEDIEIVSQANKHTTTPAPVVFYDEDADVIVTD